MPSHQRKKPVLDKVKGSIRGGKTINDGNRVSYGFAAMQGWRKQMEDAHCATVDPEHDMSFFGVFDGHGGPGAARFCAQTLAPQVLQKVRVAVGDTTNVPDKFRAGRTQVISGADSRPQLKDNESTHDMNVASSSSGGHRKHSNEKVESAVRSAFLDMDLTMSKRHSMYVTSADDDSYGDPGTTAVTVLVTPKKIIVANVGDSRALLVRDGKLAFSTKDHKPGNADEESRIKGAGGFVVSGRVCRSLAVARALGDHNFKLDEELSQEEQMVTATPDVTVLSRTDSDEYMFLGCDGIYDVMGNMEVTEFISTKLAEECPLSEICSAVVDKCFKKGSTDNMTALLICFPGASENAPKRPPRRLSIGSPEKKPSWVTSLFAEPSDTEQSVSFPTDKSSNSSAKSSLGSERPMSILMSLHDIDEVTNVNEPDHPELAAISQLNDIDNLAWIEMQALDYLVLAHEHIESSEA